MLPRDPGALRQVSLKTMKRSPGMGAPAAAGAATRAVSSTRPAWRYARLLLPLTFLGAGLLGMLFGGGLFSGLGGISSIIGLLLQVGLIFIVVRLAMSWWQRRNQTAGPPLPVRPVRAYTGPGNGPDQKTRRT